MIHPDTELRFVNNEIGYGVFSTAPILKGTIVYVKDPLDIEVTEVKYSQMSPLLQQLTEKYSYMDENGIRVVSWDHAKYVNHSCECNTMSSGYGFEVAVRDILKNEEITDEYGLFNVSYPMDLQCGCKACRSKLLPTDMDTYGAAWDKIVLESIRHVPKVPQPLWDIIDLKTRTELMGFLSGHMAYRSIYSLRYETRTENCRRTRHTGK